MERSFEKSKQACSSIRDFRVIIKSMIYVIKRKNYDISSHGEIISKKSSSFLRGPRVPIILIAFPLWTVIEIAWMMGPQSLEFR